MSCRRLTALLLLSLTSLAAAGPPDIPPPGDPFRPPDRPTAAGVPLVYEHNGEAGPDESFFVVGEGFTKELTAWGPSADRPEGQEWTPRLQFLTGGYLAATLPEPAPDGVFLIWFRNPAGFSSPIALNTPQPWWLGPDTVTAGAAGPAAPGQPVHIYGRNLARRPDHDHAFVYLRKPGRPAVRAEVTEAGKYEVEFVVPATLEPGPCEVWIHAGSGGRWGWGGPLSLLVEPRREARPREQALPVATTGPQIQAALETLGRDGGGTLLLPPGTFALSTTLRIPASVTLRGAGSERTTLQMTHDPAASFPRLAGPGWNLAPGAIHTPGDTMTYELNLPAGGTWDVWARYATDMKPWNQPGVSGNHTLAADGGPPAPLLHLENTGSFGTFRWSRSARLNLDPGRHVLTWKNEKGGGISLDAFLLSRDPAYDPAKDSALPRNGPDRVVLQAEDCTRFESKEGKLPGGDRAVAWLQGDGATILGLTLCGNAQTNLGIAIRSTQPTAWLSGCGVEGVQVTQIDGKQAENCGLHIRNADRARIVGNRLGGRVPLFLSGTRRSEYRDNRLVPSTRFGGNAEAAILGRTEPIERCVIAGNTIESPSGAEAGGPTTRRLLWFSTGHGSITNNYIARNGVGRPQGPGAAVGAGPARFGGVAGTDQNVGEMILFEGNHRTAYFGPLAGADAQGVLLPKTLPPTPDDRLGSVERKQLAHDAAGNETPFWPPDADDGSEEPPIGEYYVSVLHGRGQGQTRRIVRREDERLVLDRPWNVAPAKGSVVAVGTAFYRNLIVGNHTPDGMTGIQLWISCVENVVAANSINRQRKPGLFFYATGTTLASSMPRTWNRGIAPLFWNLAEGNRTEDCSAGGVVTSGDAPDLPVEFPRALGNILRHNSFVRSRTDGLVLSGRGPSEGVKDTAPSIAGTIVEFNVVRDARVAYHSAHGSDATLLRRNHAYFWYPVSLDPAPPVAFQVDRPGSTATIELNSIEGIHGTHDRSAIDLRTPEGDRPLPD